MNDPLLGQVIEGRYLVMNLIGVGGMGHVYLAEQLELKRNVALKILHPRASANTSTKARFHQEAMAASRINHAGCVTIHGYGEWRDRLYIAMEYVEGTTLGNLIQTEATIPGARAAQILIQVCAVLQVAHDKGILHRDLKPDNIMLIAPRAGEPCDRVKVVDFGLATILTQQDLRLTQDGMIFGTPAFMSPEQCSDKRIDHRSDIYSLGVLLHYMLCGALPFIGDNYTEIFIQHMYHEPPSLSALNPVANIHPALEALTLRALAKSPDDRPPSATAFREELEAALSMIQNNQLPPQTNRNSALLAGGRRERAEALGLPLAAPAPKGVETSSPPQSTSTGAVFVIEPISAAIPFSSTMTAHLRANGLEVIRSETIQQLFEGPIRPRDAVILVDLRADPAAILEQIARDLTTSLLGCAVVVVGADDTMNIMTRALELGCSDYIPSSQLKSKLVQRVQKAARRLTRRVSSTVRSSSGE